MFPSRYRYGRICVHALMLCLGVQLVFSLTAPAADARPTALVLSSDQRDQDLEGHVEFIFDDTGTLRDLGDLKGATGWTALGDETYTNALRPGTVWLRFRLMNQGQGDLSRVLQITNGFTDSTTAWVRQGDDSRVRYDAGEDTALEARVIPHYYPRFPIQLSPGETVEVVLRLVDEGNISAPLKVATVDLLHSNDGTRQWVNGLMSGILGLVAIYSLVLFIRVRRRLFGWLGVLAVACLLEWIFCHWGYGGLLLPTESRGWLANRLIITCFEFTAFCTFHFYIEACELKSRHPRLTKVAYAFAWLGLANAILVFAIPYSLSVDILFLAPIGLVVMALAVLNQAIHGDRVSQRLAFAAGALVLGYVLSAFTESGVIGRTWLSAYYIPLGTVSQWILFSDAVAARAGQLEEQRRAALEAQVIEERRNGELREAFGRYVTPDLAQKILDDPEATALGGRIQNITIMMSDLRGFTAMTRRLGPPVMCALLNDYLDRMTEVIENHGGWINDFVGDGILTVFGTPVAKENDGLDACRCAIEMQIALSLLNDELRAAGRPTLEMGIGIHSGEAVVGNIGSKRRVKWGVIGDPVNIAARIESLTVGTQILLSAAVLDQLPSSVITEEQRAVQVKGRTQTLRVSELRAIDGENLAMPKQDAVVYWDVEHPAQIAPIVNKVVSPKSSDACVVRLAGKLLTLNSNIPIEDGSDIVLRLAQNGSWSDPIYAKVKTLPSLETDVVQISAHITSIAPSTQQWLESLRPLESSST